jgi:hypothetical protein
MSQKALGLPIGLVLIHNGRRIRLDRYVGDWTLGFVDVETGLEYLVGTDACDDVLYTTIDWLFEEKEAGRLVDPNEGSDTDGRRRTFLGLDKSACIKRDPKSAWRFRWASAALKNGPKTTSDNSFKEWIAGRSDLIPSEDGAPEPTPPASSLRRWTRKLKAAKGRRGALVSCAGRLKGQSPLPGLEDWLVQEAALYYWAAEQPNILDAGGYYIEARDRITNGDDEELKKRLATNPVRLETIRARARSLEGAATVETKEGKRRARRMFEPAGEGVPVERFLERVEMDGVELRQIVTFSKDWPIASGKMKLINAIDAGTHFWALPAMFCGPYREDMTTIALLNLMMPPTHLTAEQLAEHPWLAEAYGDPDLIAPDNEKAIFSPGSISALTELGPDIEMPDTNHPDSKPLVEALNRFIKGFLEGLPGTVRGPRHPKDPTRNAIDEAEMTRAQLWTQILLAWFYWNTTKRPYFGNRSPIDMVEASIQADDRPKRSTPGHIRRGLSKTHDDIIITRDGFEFDGIIYQSPELKHVVDANYCHTGFKDRVDGTAKVILSIRTIEGNLHEAEVYDFERKKYVPVESTEPGYTKFLSRWEHTEFKRMMEAATPRRLTELEKMRLRAERLRQVAADLPKQNMKAAAKTAALLERDEVRRASGARVHMADYDPAGLHGIMATSGSDMRTDEPRPVHVPASPRRPNRPAAPADLLAALGGAIDDPEMSIRSADQDPGQDRDPEEFAWPGLADADDDYDDDLDCDDLDDLEDEQ